MGRTKNKLFGAKKSKWPRLEKLVENRELLPIDLAYAEVGGSAATEEEAAIYCGLCLAGRKGDLCLDLNQMQELPPLLQDLIRKGAKGETRFALPKNVYYEEVIVKHVQRLLSYPKKKTSFIPSDPLNAEQKKAVEKALTHPFSLITGGPGTGKTYTAGKIVENQEGRVILAAPTGKAASHLASKIEQKSSKIVAGTLHRLLEVRSGLDYLKDPKTLQADLMIVDEASMIDPPLFARLLQAIAPETTLVLMGDQNQLPAVAGGSLFADLIEAGLPSIHLQTCMRSDRKEILDMAQGILEGRIQNLRTIDLGFSENKTEKIYAKLWSYAKSHAPSSWLDHPDQFRILSTLRKGPLGVDALNRFLFEKFSSHTNQVPIMITRNDSQTGLPNGETGVLVDAQTAYFPDGKSFPIYQLPPYEVAYCLSVHKSQGSEYDHVLFLVPAGSEAFGREVIYTAVTRARIKLDIDGSLEQIEQALGKVSNRLSGIKEKLIGTK